MELFGTMFNIPSWDALMTFIIVRGVRILIMVIVFFIIYHLLQHGIERLINLRFTRLSGEQQRRAQTVLSLTHNLVFIIFSFFALMALLNEFNVDTTSLLAGASIIGLAVGVGAQSLVKDFVAGFFLMMENQYSIGDIVTVKGFTGFVSDVSFRTTKIQSFDKVIHTIPNGLIDIVSNYTKGLYIANVQIEVNQDIEPQRVIEVLNKALEEIKKRDDISGADASVGGIASMHDGLFVYDIYLPTTRGNAYSVCTDYRYAAVRLLREAHIPMGRVLIQSVMDSNDPVVQAKRQEEIHKEE
jgi:small-conductance mechanosensitive channel